MAIHITIQQRAKLIEFESYLKKSGEYLRLADLENIPYTDLSEIIADEKDKRISLNFRYNGQFLNVIGSKGDIFMSYFWSFMPYFIIIACIALAIVNKKWIILLGVPFAIFGFLSSSPYNPISKELSGIGCFLTIISIFVFRWWWTVIIGSMLLAQMAALTVREQYRMAIREAALSSESLFSYLYKQKMMSILDNVNRRVL